MVSPKVTDRPSYASDRPRYFISDEPLRLARTVTSTTEMPRNPLTSRLPSTKNTKIPDIKQDNAQVTRGKGIYGLVVILTRTPFPPTTHRSPLPTS